MTLLRLRYVHSFVDKTGRARHYFRYRGKRWALPDEPASAAFATRYDELVALHVQKNAPGGRVVFGPNTMGWLIEQWLGSKEFHAKSAGTQLRYRKVLDRVREICGRAVIDDLQEHHVREIRSRFMPNTSVADIAVMLLRMLWVFAKENLAIRLGQNPTTDIRNLHRRAFEHEPWPAELIAKFETEARPKPKAQLALLLLLYTGQRVGDVVAMKWKHYDGKGIAVRQQKTGEYLWIPCHSRLRAALDATAHSSEFILTTQMKDGYSAGSLSNMVALGAAEAGAKGYSAHGLRKNAAIALAEVGCTVHQIMAITGHRTYEQALHYTHRAAQKHLAEQAIEKLEGGGKVANQRTSTVRGAG